jgi:hypothetical protein
VQQYPFWWWNREKAPDVTAVLHFQGDNQQQPDELQNENTDQEEQQEEREEAKTNQFET